MSDIDGNIMGLIAILIPVLSLFVPRLSLILSGISGLFLSVLSFSLILKKFSYHLSFSTSFDILEFSYGVDSLSLFFMGVIGLVSTGVSVYSYSYINHITNKRIFVFLYNTFILSMIFVILSKNALSFLLFWELMSLISFILVLFDYKQKENIDASIIYFIMTHIGTVFIIISFGILYHFSGSLSFYDWIGMDLPDNYKLLVFLSALIGFGTKAGIFPLHIWLPKAHPVAPSNVSAIMSGLMLKIAIYMLIEYYFVFLKGYPLSYGFIVLAIGSITAVYGIMYGFVSNDIKKLLAYSSMENIGIIMMAMGIAMIFNFYGIVLLCGVAFLAMLYHTLNHAVFKSLLFMSAGVVLEKTHTKNMEYLGGLIKFMPITGIFTLIGILGITALPPFNGFVSEWMLYQSLLFGSNINDEMISIVIPIFASMLALTGSFSLATFVKMFGVSFLGKNRVNPEKTLTEANISMLLGMGMMAILVIILGLLPMMVLYFLDDVFMSIFGVSIYNSLISKYGLILTSTSYDYGRISTLMLAFAGVLIFLIIYYVIRIFGSGSLRQYETWSCGLSQSNTTVKAQYSSVAFSAPIRRILSFVFYFKERFSSEEGKKYFFPKKTYSLKVYDIVEVLYFKFTDMVLRVILRVRYYMQPGIIHIYITFIILTLTILLVFVRI